MCEHCGGHNFAKTKYACYTCRAPRPDNVVLLSGSTGGGNGGGGGGGSSSSGGSNSSNGGYASYESGTFTPQTITQKGNDASASMTDTQQGQGLGKGHGQGIVPRSSMVHENPHGRHPNGLAVPPNGVHPNPVHSNSHQRDTHGNGVSIKVERSAPHSHSNPQTASTTASASTSTTTAFNHHHNVVSTLVSPSPSRAVPAGPGGIHLRQDKPPLPPGPPPAARRLAASGNGMSSGSTNYDGSGSFPRSQSHPSELMSVPPPLPLSSIAELRQGIAQGQALLGQSSKRKEPEEIYPNNDNKRQR